MGCIMQRSVRDPQTATALDVEPVVQRHVTCPLCHTTDAFMSNDALAAGGAWRCTRCGQRWDARRLAAVAAYAAWTLERSIATGRTQGPLPPADTRVADVLVREGTVAYENGDTYRRLPLPLLS
jgi:predicted Zn finger-like uncharacterized protein